MNTANDFLFVNHGSVCILYALSDDAKQWVEDNLCEDRLTYASNGVVIEPRYVSPILEGIDDDGLTVAA